MWSIRYLDKTFQSNLETGPRNLCRNPTQERTLRYTYIEPQHTRCTARGLADIHIGGPVGIPICSGALPNNRILGLIRTTMRPPFTAGIR